MIKIEVTRPDYLCSEIFDVSMGLNERIGEFLESSREETPIFVMIYETKNEKKEILFKGNIIKDKEKTFLEMLEKKIRDRFDREMVLIGSIEMTL